MKIGKGDFVTFVMLGAVAVIEAVNETLKLEPQMAAHIPSFFVSSFWHFVPFTLLCLIGLIWLAKQLRPHERQVAVDQVAVDQVSVVPFFSAPVPAQEPQRVFANVNPSYLVGLYENRTTVQGGAFAAAYIGKWIVVTGRVKDITGGGSGLLVQISDAEGKWIAAHFAKASEKISYIPHGAMITVRGEIRLVDSLRVWLHKCELDGTGSS